MLTLDRHAVADALPFDRLIDAIESAFRTGAMVPDRTHHRIEVPGHADAALLMMPAWRPGKSLGVKIVSIFPDNTRRSLPSVNATYLLCDAQTGQPRAILDGMELTVRRTAAASALASRYLSRSDASTLLMVGTGKLAPPLIAAHASVRTLSEVLVWGRRRVAAEAVQANLANETYSVTVVDNLEAAVREADIVSCATLATEPLICGAWLSEGQHIDLVGAFRPDMREADGEALAKADVYVDTRAGVLAEAGDVIQAIAQGDLQESDIIGDFYDLTRGICRGRESARTITLFKSVGTALEDLAAAELAIARAT